MFCRNCGEKIKKDVTTCPKCQSEVVIKKLKSVYCTKCGEVVDKFDEECPHCGEDTGVELKPGEADKKGFGSFLGFFFTWIGLFLGICLYKYGTNERDTFVDGWTMGVVANFILTILVVIITLLLTGYIKIG